MAWTDKLKSLANSPKGRELIDRGRRELSKPETQQKLRQLRNKITKSR